MKEIPMLFKTDMVKTILNGSKTQTRRIAKVPNGYQITGCADDLLLIDSLSNPNIKEFVRCPYGNIGDVIWVKETYYALGRWVKDGISLKGRQKWRFEDKTPIGNYGFMDSVPQNVIKRVSQDYGWYKRPSLFMPKIAARIKLEITGLRLERLQDITEEDAIAEGVEKSDCSEIVIRYKNYLNSYGSYSTPSYSYRTLWEKINGKDSWSLNPFVWVIEFKKL